MKRLQQLLDRIIQRVNINLREAGYDIAPFVRHLIPAAHWARFYATYGISPNHPTYLELENSSLCGSYLLGKCSVKNALLYQSDIRGDELKKKGDRYQFEAFDIPIHEDERFDIQDSLLIKTLVHNCSHDPETLENFFITNTVALHYANIHGSPVDGSFLGPFATVDLTTTSDCVAGPFCYLQAGEMGHRHFEPGTVWIKKPDNFEFLYRFPVDRLKRYISFQAGQAPKGQLIDFIENHRADFQRFFQTVDFAPEISVPDSASLDLFAVVKPDTHIAENVLVSEHAYLENSRLGKGANAQENCYIINSTLAGDNVTAHGAKIIAADLGSNVFVGFNSFLNGRDTARLTIGQDSVIMPHTIIDSPDPVVIPPGHIAWGLIANPSDLKTHCMALQDFAAIDGEFQAGNLAFHGSGAAFVSAFKHRIRHILEANGAFFDGKQQHGHAQKNRNMSFALIQHYGEGASTGLCPSLSIRP
jgi:carbonic anhydrase/acetyltransferase-like protein (isoleucine patch superfamily)